jgi:hypothetical protein
MLKIRSEQMRPFEAQAENAFIERVMNYLRENHADDVVLLPESESKVSALPDKVLREMVEGGIDHARNYGITWKSALISFVVLMFIIAPNFDESERAEGILKDGGIPADERVDKLLDELTDEEWDEIAKDYKPEAWRLPLEVETVEEKTYERAT